jgi:hypothetical protein
VRIVCRRTHQVKSRIFRLEYFLHRSPVEGLMPKAWTAKDERQYEHIKDSERKEGRSAKRSKQIAAATVNKRRKSEGRTKS